MSDPNETKAKMVALLALLDVLQGSAEMTTVGTDRVGHNDRYGRGGKIRLKFTVFGDETRLLELAHELTLIGSQDGMMRKVASLIQRDDKLRFAARMIETWTEVMQRLLAEPDRRALADPVTRIEAGQGPDVNLDRFGNRTVRKLPEGAP